MSEHPTSGPSPDVSVVVVVRNDRDRVLDCLRSVEDQSIRSRDVETVVVDDGSTDGTADAVRAAFPAARVISKPNEGADLSRNRGIDASRGRVIAFIDSDCVARRDWLDNLVRSLDSDPSAVVGGRVVHRGPFYRRLTGIADFGEYQGSVRRGMRSLPTRNLGLGRSILGDVRFDPAVATAGGDTVFTETLRRNGATLIYDPEVEVEHRPAASFADFMRRAERYGESFVRARQLDPDLRYAALVRAGIPGVAAAPAARIALDWTRLVRHRRDAGFSIVELPAAAAMLALRRAASFPAAARAVFR